MHRSLPTSEPTPRSLSALSAYHSGVLTPMKIRSESQSALRLYSGSPTRSDKDTVSISSFYYKERVRNLLSTSTVSEWHFGANLSECPNFLLWYVCGYGSLSGVKMCVIS